MLRRCGSLIDCYAWLFTTCKKIGQVSAGTKLDSYNSCYFGMISSAKFGMICADFFNLELMGSRSSAEPAFGLKQLWSANIGWP